MIGSRCSTSVDLVTTNTTNDNIVTVTGVDLILVLVLIQRFRARFLIRLTVRNIIYTNGNRFGSCERGCRIQITITFRKEHLGIIAKDNIVIINAQAFVVKCRMILDIFINVSILLDDMVCA